MKLIWGKDYSFGSEIILFPLRMENSSESFTKQHFIPRKAKFSINIQKQQNKQQARYTEQQIQ